jgi:hypothetical protein
MKTVTLKNYKEILGEDESKYNWKEISECQILSEDFIEDFQDKVAWEYISRGQTLSEEFIRDFQEEFNWHYVSKYQKLSEEFIREFKEKVNWNHISKYQKLSEEFIREFKDEVNWENISRYQNTKDNREQVDIHYGDKFNRVIYIKLDSLKIIHIGCFNGTKKEAIKKIKSSDYNKKDKKKYIKKIKKCFKLAKKKLKELEEKKVINFKEWLEDQGIYSNMFWKNCKRKNQGWSHKDLFYSRRDFENIEVRDWIMSAFSWENTMIPNLPLSWDTNVFDMFDNLSNDWRQHILVDNPDAIVELGFRK